MALECYCLKLFSFHGFQLQQLSKKMGSCNVFSSQCVGLHLRTMSPTLSFCWPFKNNYKLTQGPSHGLLLVSFDTHNHLGMMGLKYQSNHKQNFVKEVKRQGIRLVKGNEVVKGVGRAILDKKRLTEERWKNNSKRILADIKETKSKMKEKMEEIVERENVWTVPNLLCVSRIAMSPVLGYLILEQDFHYALGLLTIAGITDLLDGWIARTFKNQSSKLGSFLDPMADKILIATMFLTLTYAGIIPVPLTMLIITRDVALVGAGFIIRYKSLPPPETCFYDMNSSDLSRDARPNIFPTLNNSSEANNTLPDINKVTTALQRTLSRYFDVTHATAQLAPTFISKVNTMVQLVTVAATLAAPVFGYLDHVALQSLWCITAGTTVASAGSYLLSKNTFKFLKKSS